MMTRKNYSFSNIKFLNVFIFLLNCFDFIIIFDREPWTLYRLSYLWYTVTGALVTMSVGLVVSLISSEDVDKLDPMLMAPFLRKYLKRGDADLDQVKVRYLFSE